MSKYAEEDIGDVKTQAASKKKPMNDLIIKQLEKLMKDSELRGD